MKIKIKVLTPEGIDLNEEQDADWLSETLTNHHAARSVSGESIRVKLRAKAHEGTVQIDGEMVVPLVFSCVRCLSEWRAFLPIPIGHTYCLGSRDESETKDRELTREDMQFDYYDGDEIDLDPSLREDLLLNLELNPLCRDDCKGLCPQCGKNRNVEICKCQADDMDPRLAPLKKIVIK